MSREIENARPRMHYAGMQVTFSRAGPRRRAKMHRDRDLDGRATRRERREGFPRPFTRETISYPRDVTYERRDIRVRIN